MSWIRAVAAVAVRPSLWRIAVRQVVRHAPNGWWKRRPFLPLPDRRWMRFRSETMYGDPEHKPEPADVVAWLQWCRSMP